MKILADGSDLDRSIRGELDDIDKEFGNKGREHAKKYDAEMEKQLRKDSPRNAAAIDRMFEKHGAKARALAREIDSTLFQQLDKDIRQGHGEILGDRIMRDIRKGFISGGGWKSFGKDFEHLLDQLPALTAKANREITRENEQLERDRVSRFQQSVTEITAGYDRITRGSKNSVTGQRDNLNQTISSLRRLRTELDRTPSLGGKDHGQTARLLRDMERGLDRIHPRLGRLSGSLERSAEGMGRLFGKGSRNDFLNFTGVVIEGIGKVVAKGPRIVSSLLDVPRKFGEMKEAASGFFSVFTEGIRVGAGPIESLKGAFGSLEASGTSLFSSLSAGVVALPVVVAAIGTVVAAGSLLLGVITALASTISFALVGALGVALGLLGPLTAVVAVLALAFAGLGNRTSEAHKQLSAFLKPITSQLKELAQVTRKHLFAGLADDGKEFGKGLGTLKPLIVGTADALNHMFGEVSLALASNGFKRYMDEVTPIILKMLPELGAAAGHTARAIGGIFLGVLPSADDFLVSLDKLTAKFDKWANSAGGQNQIKKFMDDAKDSAKSLGHFIGQVSGLLGDLLFNSEGKKTGDSLFDQMADGIKRFRDYIKGDGLKKWFQDSKEFGEKLGDTIVSIGKVLDDLDSPGFRSFAKFMIETFTVLGYLIGLIVKPVNDLIESFDRLFHLDFSGFDDASTALTKDLLNALTLGLFDKVVGAFKDFGTDIIGGLLGGLDDAVQSVIDWFGSLPQKFVSAFVTPLGIHSPSTVFAGFGGDIIAGLFMGLVNALPEVLLWLAGIGLQMLGALAGLPGLFLGYGATLIGNLVSGISEGVGNALSFVSGLATNIGHAFSDVVGGAFESLKGKASDLGNFLKGGLSSAFRGAESVGRSVGSAFSGAVSNAVNSLRDKASDLGSMFKGILSSGFHAGRDAADGVKSAISGIGSIIGGVIDKVKSLISWLGKIHIPHLDPGGGVPFVPGIKTGGLVDAFGLHRLKKMAAGGLANFAQRYQIGEAGREAIVPLDRPLGQVDPAVRLLSAFAQGKLGNVTNSADKTIDASGWIIQTPTKDPLAVAREVLDALTAKIV